MTRPTQHEPSGAPHNPAFRLSGNSAAVGQSVFTSTEPSNHLHADWLGTSRLSLDVSGNLYVARSYAPFGEAYNGATGSAGLGANDRSFTGQTQDVIAGPTGVYDFLFRQQASSQGRWLVPDPAGLAAVDITNPQTWNRYAYLANNPMSNLDPLGLRIVCTSTNGDRTCRDEPDPPDGSLDLLSMHSKAHSLMPTYTLAMWDDTFGTGPCKGDPDCLARTKQVSREEAANNGTPQQPQKPQQPTHSLSRHSRRTLIVSSAKRRVST